jgi:hypothetical protein
MLLQQMILGYDAIEQKVYLVATAGVFMRHNFQSQAPN